MARKDAVGLFWEDVKVERVSTAKEKVKCTPPPRTWEEPDYLPNLAEARAFNVPLFNDVELVAAAYAKERLVWDIESYPNYTLIAFKSIVSGKVVYFELSTTYGQDKILNFDTETWGLSFNNQKLQWVLDNFCIIGFNSKSYDQPIVTLALGGATTEDLWSATEQIIIANVQAKDLYKRAGVKKLIINHIDIIEVAPLRASLKIYAGRLHARRMQDLPFKPGTVLSDDQIDIVRLYCINDLDNTQKLYDSLTEQVSLREAMNAEYKFDLLSSSDLRSKSDAQIAETVISDAVAQINRIRCQRPTIAIGTVYQYNVPHFITYQSPLMNWVLNVVRNAQFIVDESGSVGMPPELKELKLNIGNSTYQMGIGGLHSTESKATHYSDELYMLVDRDVESYYPKIILNQRLYPKHLGEAFLRVYEAIVNRRLDAKHRGDKVTADSLKITINGSFGKLGSMWSVLYAPDLLIQTTITGQLCLLMIIERLEMIGISVVSANTDGVVIKCPRHRKHEMDAVFAQWERDTNFKTEETRYAALHSKDVNNYIAVKYKQDKVTKEWTDEIDGVKTKGAYAKAGLQKNPTNGICVDAVTDLLTKGKPIRVSVQECKDVTKFVSVRSVTGGAWQDGVFLGKSIRWYYAAGHEGNMVYANSGKKVPRSDGAKPLMDLPETLPDDINYDWYVNEAESMLGQIGYNA
jgi:hypothetical protein